MLAASVAVVPEMTDPENCQKGWVCPWSRLGRGSEKIHEKDIEIFVKLLQFFVFF